MRVATLSDITTADGKYIEKCFWEGEKRYDSKLLWPHQAKPNEKAFQIWRRCLTSTFLLDTSTRATKNRDKLELNIPLGPWFHSARKSFDRYENFYSPTNKAIYILYREYSFFQKHKMIQRRNLDDSIKYFEVKLSNTIAALPIDAVPTNPIFNNTAISATINLTYPCRIDKATTSWEEHLAQRTTWEKEILQNINHLDLQTLLSRIMLGQSIYICSDGGANNKSGSFAAVLATDDRILVVISGVVHGESPGREAGRKSGEHAEERRGSSGRQ